MRQISDRKVQATWTAPAGFSGVTYRVYINTDMVNTGGTAVNDGTTFTSASYTTGFTATLRIRATTGTYYSVPAVSETFTVRGKTCNIMYVCKYINSFKIAQTIEEVESVWVPLVKINVTKIMLNFVVFRYVFSSTNIGFQPLC